MVVHFFYARNGGWLRRYVNFRTDLFQISWRTPDRLPTPPVALFDFSRAYDAADAAKKERNADSWRISDDRVIGGYSNATATFFSSTKDLHNKGIRSDGDSTVDGGTDTDSLLVGDDDDRSNTGHVDFSPFLRWSGTLDTTIGLQSNVQRSGFAALKSPDFAFDGANLQGLFNAVEITCRPDHRVYTVNLNVSSAIPDDVYQIEIGRREEDSGRAVETYVIPFSSFRLTSKGRERAFFRVLDNDVSIESVGFTLMDGQDGDFLFDLYRIRAVNLGENRAAFEPGPLERKDIIR